MEEKEFAELVERLEIYSRAHPTAYKIRVGLLAALGYLYLFAVVIGILLIVGAVLVYGSINFLVIKLLLIPLGIAAVVLRSLWIKFPEPEGHELQLADAPRLFELVREVREATRGPWLYKTLLTDHFNAGIVQRPRFGIFGWPRNYLVIGLPLLKALSPEDVRAVIAHEFGHLSGNRQPHGFRSDVSRKYSVCASGPNGQAPAERDYVNPRRRDLSRIDVWANVYDFNGASDGRSLPTERLNSLNENAGAPARFTTTHSSSFLPVWAQSTSPVIP